MHVKGLLVCRWISLDLEDKGKCQKEKSTINIGGLSLKRKIIMTTTRSGTQRDTHREKPPHKKLSLFVFSPEISKLGGVKNKSCFQKFLFLSFVIFWRRKTLFLCYAKALSLLGP